MVESLPLTPNQARVLAEKMAQFMQCLVGSSSACYFTAPSANITRDTFDYVTIEDSHE